MHRTQDVTMMLQAFRRFDESDPVVSLVDYYAHVDTPRHPQARKLLDYWRACVEARGSFVVGRDVPARPIAGLLQNIVINEPIPGSADMRVRIAGSAVRRRFGGDIKGHVLSEIFSPEDFRHRLAVSCEVVRSGVPAILDSSLKRGNVEELHTEIVMLPVKARDLTSNWLLAGIFYFS